MAALDQKSPNVLLQSLCCRITGKSEAEVAHQFQYAVRVIGSNYAPTIERDEFLVSEKIKKELLKQRREADAALFSELHRKLQTQGVLKHRWSVLYLLLSLCEDPRKPSTRTTTTAAKTAKTTKKTPWCAWTREMEERLVELWREHPCLFDVSHELFHNRIEKDKSWLDIAIALQLPVEEVQTKAKKLRAQYSRMLKPKPSGSGSKPLTSRQKWLVRVMDFIKQHIVHRAPKTTLDVPTSEQDETEDEDTQDFELSSESPIPDHLSNFGNLVAHELRQIKDPGTLIRLKRNVMSLIYDAQAAEMNGSSSSSPPAPYTFNPAILPLPAIQCHPQYTFLQGSQPQGSQSHPQYMSHQGSQPQGSQSRPQYMSLQGSQSQSYLQSLQNSDPSDPSL